MAQGLPGGRALAPQILEGAVGQGGRCQQRCRHMNSNFGKRADFGDAERRRIRDFWRADCVRSEAEDDIGNCDGGCDCAEGHDIPQEDAKTRAKYPANAELPRTGGGRHICHERDTPHIGKASRSDCRPARAFASVEDRGDIADGDTFLVRPQIVVAHGHRDGAEGADQNSRDDPGPFDAAGTEGESKY